MDKRQLHDCRFRKVLGAVGQYACGSQVSDREKKGEVLQGKSVIACTGSSVMDIRKAADGLLIEARPNDRQGARLLMLKKIGKIEVK